MSLRLQRFDFGSLRDFRGPLVVAPEPEAASEEELAPPPPPTYSEAEIEAARSEGRDRGYAEGFDAGLARATERQEAKRLAADTVILQMGQQLQSLGEGYQRLLDTESEALSQLVSMIAKKVAGEALQTNVTDTILALVSRCLPVILSKPRLTIDLHPESFENAIGNIETLLQASGFEGEIQFRTNPSLGAYDAVLDWGIGSAARSTATLWQEIESLLAQMPVTLAPLDVKTDRVEPKMSEITEQNSSDSFLIEQPTTE